MADFLLKPIKQRHRNEDKYVSVDAADGSVSKIEPIADFVIKTKLLSANGPEKLQDGRKVFINVCHSPLVPKPEVDFNARIVFPLIIQNEWEIPIITSCYRMDHDKKGQECYVWDCCINSDCSRWICEDIQLREILVEWCLESCEIRDSVVLCRDRISFPKMKKKGAELPALEVLNDELHQDYKAKMHKIIEEEAGDPMSILRGRNDDGDDNNDPDDGTLPPLFPIENKISGAKIEEIDKNEIAHRNLKQAPAPAPAPAPHEQQEDVPEYEVKMKRFKGAAYKLRILIENKAPNSKPDQFSPSYNFAENILYINGKLSIPLPRDIVVNAADIKIFHIRKERTLYIYI
ncbi:Pih1p [Saccharomyces cerevisiae YJM1418]|nr:Pih1p [Saccharomyces cerevisiae YJM1418]CAD6633203.1 HLJ1_G0055430.mRNA.1.CDS.1 [Saccharomyces cerevisiae]CAI4516779.1 CCN_G0023600.mRNA.1.CDS.1 [Saccharomyces cerevisiae]CAI7326703.1 CCN_G0023600.mRNA.1.CDS.1 [Saccharomyces cerevisiae]